MAEPSILGTAARAWRSTFAALAEMPLAFLITSTVIVALEASLLRFMPTLANVQLDPVSSVHPLPQTAVYTILGRLFLDFLRSLIVAPLAIAVHRFILLGERSPTLPIIPLPRVLRFTGWLTIITVVNDIAGQLSSIFLLQLITQIIMILVTTRLLLLFPAVAVDAPDAEPRASWRDTKGHFWRIFLILLVTTLPVWVILITLIWRSSLDDLAPNVTWVMSLFGVCHLLFTITGVTAASWLFRSYHKDPTILINQ